MVLIMVVIIKLEEVDNIFQFLLATGKAKSRGIS